MDEIPQDLSRAVGALRAREASIRDAAHFSLVRHRAGPFRLRQMLPMDALILYAANNPLFAGRRAARVSLSSIGAFLLVLCAPVRTHDHPARLWQAWIAARLIGLRLRRRKHWLAFCARLDAYVGETFVDWPAGSASDGPRPPPAVLSSFLAWIIDLVASRYHWARAEILGTPLRELLIYRKHILADLRREAKLKNPPEISRGELAIKGEFLNALEAANAGAKGRN